MNDTLSFMLYFVVAFFIIVVIVIVSDSIVMIIFIILIITFRDSKGWKKLDKMDMIEICDIKGALMRFYHNDNHMIKPVHCVSWYWYFIPEWQSMKLIKNSQWGN